MGWYLDLVEPKEPLKPGELHPESDWETLFIQTLRQRQLAYRTEQTYLGWLKRFERFCQGQDLRTISNADVQRFLSDLAVKQGVRASTQNQAFNALLFLYRDVFGRKNLDWPANIRMRLRNGCGNGSFHPVNRVWTHEAGSNAGIMFRRRKKGVKP